MASNRYHVSNSTEGWFVMSDTRIMSGPIASKTDAYARCDDLNDSDLLSTLLGEGQTYADELEKIKTRVLLPLATADRHDLQAQFDFDTLDRFVCRMRELVALQQKNYEERIHGRD